MADDNEEIGGKQFSSLRAILGLMERYGVALVFLCVFVWGGWTVGGRLYDDFLIPIRDHGMQMMKTVEKTQVDQAESLKSTSEAVENTSRAVEAISTVVQDARKDNTEIRAIATEHYSITKQTADDVKAIKAAVVPEKHTGTPTLAPPLVNRPSPTIVQPN